METIRSTVIAAFSSLSKAKEAVRDLHEAGFSSEDVKLIENDRERSMSANTQRTSSWAADYAAEPESKGGIMQFFSRLFGLDDEATQRGSRGSLASYDLQPDSRLYFEEQYDMGRHLVLVEGRAEQERAMNILRSHGAMIEDRASLLFEQGRMRREPLAEDSDSDRVMQLNEEVLSARKESVQTGEVTLRKEIVTESRTIQVPVSREELVIERRAVEPQEFSAGAGHERSIGQNEEIRIPISEEQVRVDKRVVPREEVRVSKQKVEHMESISEEVRREEIDIDERGEVRLEGDRLKGSHVPFDAKRNSKDDAVRAKMTPKDAVPPPPFPPRV